MRCSMTGGTTKPPEWAVVTMLSEIPGTGFVRVMFEQGCKVEKGEHHMMPVDSIPWFLDWLAAVEAAVRADQIKKDAAICQRIQDDPEFQESGPGVVTAKIVIRAQRAVAI